MPKTISLLEELAKKRTGGSESMKGFVYQCKFAIYKMLDEFSISESSQKKIFHLEGVEDIDLYKKITNLSSNTFTQVKCKNDGIDSTEFNENILANFVELHLIDKEATLELVCNNNLRGNLKKVIEANQKKKMIPKKVIDFWEVKIQKLISDKPNWNFSGFELGYFLSKISCSIIPEKILDKKVLKLIVDQHHIQNNTENQLAQSLYYNAFIWSKKSEKITFNKFTTVIKDFLISQQKAPTNRAISERWIEPISFENPFDKEIIKNYFEGKPAKPYHIGAGLPIKRNLWEQKILDSINEFDVTVIKASSGQGKSTLLWQVVFSQMENYTPYELHFLETDHEVGEITSYLETLIRLGEIPIIIIDGLKYSVKNWSQLVRRTSHLPIKFLISSREEDWHRYRDYSLNLATININLDYQEAELIFRAFQKKGKIHPSINNWQSQWVKIKQSGLLIEYVYLLTQGNMLKERLQGQIDNLDKEENGNQKRQILELVSIADICGITLSSSKLIKKITPQFSSIGHILECLKSEYQIYIQDGRQIEGLHQVRSKHLSEILHNSLPISITLEKLIEFIDDKQLSTFCTEATLLLKNKEEQKDFFQLLSKKLITRPYYEIVEAIKGIFSTDAYLHWKKNQEVYDELFEGQGGLIYAADNIPFNNSQFRPVMEKILKESKNPPSVGFVNQYERIKKWKKEDSNIFFFIQFLAENLSNHNFKKNLSGLGHLIKWFQRFELKPTIFRQISMGFLEENYSTCKIEELGELLIAIQESNPEVYKKFIENNYEDIIGKFKVETNTLSVYQKNGEISIEYFAELGEESKENLSLQSFNRLCKLKNLLPHFSKYNAQGIYQPLPMLDMLKERMDDSKKHIPPENLTNKFTIESNQSWLLQITSKYAFDSLYDLLEYYYSARQKAIAILKNNVRILEKALEGDLNYVKKNGHDAINRMNAFTRFSKTKKTIIYDEKFNEEAFKKYIDQVKSWSSAFETFIINFPQEENAWKRFNFIAEDCFNKILKMQAGFDFIQKNSFQYFNTIQLVESEKSWYQRFEKTSKYYELYKSKPKVVSAKKNIDRWWNGEDKERMIMLNQILKQISNLIGLDLIAPKISYKDGVLRRTSIGLVGNHFNFLNDTEKTFYSLTVLTMTDIDYFDLVFVQDGVVQNNSAISFSSRFLTEVKEAIESNSELESGFSLPSPIPVTEEMISVFDNIRIQPIEKKRLESNILLLLILLWKFSKIREKLIGNSKVEKNWRAEQELKLNIKIKHHLDLIKIEDSTGLLFLKYFNLTETILKDKINLSEIQFQNLLHEDIAQKDLNNLK